MDPPLTEFAGHLGADERRMLARKFSQWAKYLRLSAAVLEAEQKRDDPQFQNRLAWKPRKPESQ
jgi:hypothetical protein